MVNRVVLVGRLTRDPEMKYTPQGVPVAQLGIAVNRFSKNEQGDYETDFFNVVAWRRSAEFASQYLKKGRLISVDGRLQQRSWVAQDGTKRSVYEIVADNVQGLDRPSDAEPAVHDGHDGHDGDTAATPVAAARPASSQGSTTRPRPPASAAPPDDDLDESDPFADE
jgi:single-strand DNA-binding protein